MLTHFLAETSSGGANRAPSHDVSTEFHDSPSAQKLICSRLYVSRSATNGDKGAFLPIRPSPGD